MKAGSAAAATGALGALAGCAGGGGGGGGGGGDNGSGGNGSGGDGGGSSEELTISYVSGQAAENSRVRNFFQQMMKKYSDQNKNVTVDLQPMSYADIKSKLSSTVAAGNPPALAEAGTLGLKFFNQGKVPKHGKFFEGSKHWPDDMTATNKGAAQFRGDWWSGGAIRHTVCQLGIRPKTFSKVGVSDPHKDVQTWSDLYGYLEKIQKNEGNIIPWEETGAYNDLESYWAEARTAYTGGTDPWIRGKGTDPTVVIGNQDHPDRPKTDGMIVNCVKLANQFSSSKAASRTNEEMPSLVLTGRAASYNYVSTHPTSYTSIKQDAKIGWHGGDGDIMALPTPKLDPDYGNKVGIDMLAGKEGAHGGHVWALEQCQSVFDVSKKKQQAGWDLHKFVLTDKDFVLPMWGKYYGATPGYAPLLDTLLQEYDVNQFLKQALNNLKKYGSQYASTGASWDVKGTSDIRWNSINKTISKAIAGQIAPEDTPGQIRKRALNVLKQQNQ